jgi:hypothetical protein
LSHKKTSNVEKNLNISAIIIYSDAPHFLCCFSQPAEHGFHLVVKSFFAYLNQHSPLIFSGIAKSCLIVVFYHLAIVLGDLGSQSILPEFNSPSFLLISKEFGVFLIQKCQ